ncbi:MAG: DUF350 domain-containing protein [Chloroflexi bacterium]|nr:DUF350 domain-containing protein [Chloroflexota bacterium]
MEQLFFNLLLAAIFSIFGFVLLFVGYKVFDALTPAHVDHKIFEQGNVAAAIVASAFILGISIIVAASIAG